MAKLSDETLEEARNMIRAGDIDGVGEWMARNRILIDREFALETFRKMASVGEYERAVRFFDRVFVDMDPAADARAALVKLGALAVAALGALGGIAFLVWMVVG